MPCKKSFGVSAEIGARVSEQAYSSLKGPIQRVALPDGHAPTSVALEQLYYPDENNIIKAVMASLQPESQTNK